MKKALFIVSLLFLLVSCLKEPGLTGYSVNLTVDFGADFPQDKKAGATITLFNQQKNYKINANTDAEGKILFPMVEPGFYSVTVSHSLGSGNIRYQYNGQDNIEVFSNKIATIIAKPAVPGAFVIKEVYYCGSRTPAGKAYYADQYIELFNNTNEVQYADGISVFEHESNGNGVNMWESLKDTVVAEMIWTIPGNGTQYAVQPGKSIVIAQDGINHRDDPNGNPLSPVNLGNADFEFYVYTPKNKDVDSPLVSNMLEDYTAVEVSEVTFRVQGGSAIAIAKIPGSTDEERKAYISKNLVAKPSSSGSSTSYYPKIANKFIIDAVETVEDEAHAIYKRFPSEIDAGYTYVTTGSYSGKCVRRKIKEVVSGRVVYQDTNNSTEDFLKDADPKPKIYE